VRSLLLASTAALAGCGSFTHFQTARSLDAGTVAFDTQLALIADIEGFNFSTRVRAGLGMGFEAGLETDIVSLLLLEVWRNPARYGLIVGDLKWQALYESGTIPVSAAIGFGGGTGFLTDFYFGQATVSRNLGAVEPYIAWRYQRFHLDRDPKDPDDREDLDDSYLEEVLVEAEGTRFGLHHVFFGVKVMISDHVFITPEVSWFFGDADGLGSIGLSVGWLIP
jgi:hypothetical protein